MMTAAISNYKISCLIVRLIMVTMTVNAQTIAPTSSPSNTTNATTFAPTLVPAVATSDPPTVVPVPNATSTAAPTNTPTVPPVMNTTAPTSSPTMTPSLNATSMPSDTFSMSPTAFPSAEPTSSPRPSPLVPVPTIPPTNKPTKKPTKKPTAVPSAMPIKADTIPPVATENTKATIKNIQIVFAGVSTIPGSDLLQLQTVMEEWFQEYFNEGQNVTSQRELQQNHRSVQQYRVPSVRNMNTVIDVSGQDTSTTSGSNIVTYTQNLEYDATEDAKTPEDYALLPFVDTAYKGELLTRLQSEIESFADVTTISTPVIAEPTKTEESDGGLSLPIIIGIVAGGVVGLLLLACGAYALGSRRDTRYPVGDGAGGSNNMNNSNLNSGYISTDEHDNMLPPSTFQMSIGDDDVISTMDDPTVAKLSNTMSGGDASALGGYGDQSVATVDYDYSKAYGGGGDTSVVSSVGGTLGDATRQTAGEVAAGRSALGASYDDNRDSTRLPREQVIVVEAPAGKLGVVIDTPDDGAPVVHAVKDTSVIANQIQVGDKLIKVDDEDVRSMTAIKVSKLISKKSANPVRRLTIVRTSQQGGGNP